jgi:hypothetical protein
MPNPWLEDIVTAPENLGGSASYRELYEEVRRLRGNDLPMSWQETIRRTIQDHSSDSEGFRGNDIFHSIGGLGSGTWGLRKPIRHTPRATDLEDPQETRRVRVETYRVLRDTLLARTLKNTHQGQCQICGTALRLSDGTAYAEAHHIKPLGRDHNGPDIKENILVLCPNHHALCDQKAMPLNINELRQHADHSIGMEFIEYHNEVIRRR